MFKFKLKYKIAILSASVFAMFLLIMPAPKIYAASGDVCEPDVKVFSIPTWYKYLGGEKDNEDKCRATADIAGATEEGVAKAAIAILLGVFDIILFLAGIIAGVFILIGGFQYMLSQGEPERSKNARTTLINALIGLAITISASAIVNLIGRTV